MLPNKNFWRNKKVLITGHTGFKGSWLSAILLKMGANVYGFSLKPNKKSLFNEIRIHEDIKSYFGDINEPNKFNTFVKKVKPEIIFHLAAQPLVIDSYNDPIKTYEINVLGSVNVLESIYNNKFTRAGIIVTTDKCYKNQRNKKSFKETDELGGKDPYSLSKVFVEQLVEQYKKNHKKRKRIATVRAGNVLGPGDYGKYRIIPDIIRAIENKQKIIIRNPKSIRPWQDVLDVLNGYICLCEKVYENTKFEGSWNFGPNSKKDINVKKLTELMISRFEYSKGYSFINNNNFVEEKYLKLDSTKSRKMLKWKSKIKTIDTINNIFSWQQIGEKFKNKRMFINKLIFDYFNF